MSEPNLLTMAGVHRRLALGGRDAHRQGVPAAPGAGARAGAGRLPARGSGGRVALTTYYSLLTTY